MRFTPKTKDIIERRFPGNFILSEELIHGYDYKLRYPRKIRYKIYKTILDAIRKKFKNVCIYLCMEDKHMWNSLKKYHLQKPESL